MEIRPKRWVLTDVSREVKVQRWDLDLFCVTLLTGCLVVSVSRESNANMYKYIDMQDHLFLSYTYISITFT